MVIHNGKRYLNLVEAVIDNAAQIDNLRSVTGLLGIRVVAQIETIEDLPAEDSELFASLEYGDAYILIVSEEEGQYSFYVKTRANTANPQDHWFLMNLRGIQGPRGPRGEKGDPGEDTPPINVVTTLPEDPQSAGYNPGDVFMTTSSSIAGNIYVLNSGYGFEYNGSIRGIQGNTGATGAPGRTGEPGPAGPVGPQGDPGGFIEIQGRVASTSQLPIPPVKPTYAYFVGTATPAASNPLYIWAPEIGWVSLGVLNVATYVTVNGEFVGQWDSDTKVDKMTLANRLYATNGTGGAYNIEYSTQKKAWTMAWRIENGRLLVGTAEEDNDAVNLAQMNAALPKIIRI